ncbi:MAG: alpha/beta hydrolase [Actinocatenispora sp.]
MSEAPAQAARRPGYGPPPYGAPPAVAEQDGAWLYRDALVARIDGFRPLMLDLSVPMGRSEVPVVVWIHGGAWLHGSHKDQPGPVPSRQIRASLLDAGIAVAAVQYRLSGEAVYPAQLHDVKAAVRWLRHHAGVLGLDPARFAAWGDSAGGHLAALLAVTGTPAAGGPDTEGDLGLTGVSSAVRACVNWYGVTELDTMQAQSHPYATVDHDAPDAPESRLIGAPVRSAPELAAAASATTYVTAGAAPMLLLHGVEDRTVPIGQSEVLADAYRRAGARAEFVPVPGADHVFDGVDRRPLIDRSVHFLRTELGVG